MSRNLPNIWEYDITRKQPQLSQYHMTKNRLNLQNRRDRTVWRSASTIVPVQIRRLLQFPEHYLNNFMAQSEKIKIQMFINYISKSMYERTAWRMNSRLDEPLTNFSVTQCAEKMNNSRHAKRFHFLPMIIYSTQVSGSQIGMSKWAWLCRALLNKSGTITVDPQRINTVVPNASTIFHDSSEHNQYVQIPPEVFAFPLTFTTGCVPFYFLVLWLPNSFAHKYNLRSRSPGTMSFTSEHK